jgi:hypothetical protein
MLLRAWKAEYTYQSLQLGMVSRERYSYDHIKTDGPSTLRSSLHQHLKTSLCMLMLTSISAPGSCRVGV